MYHSGLHNLCKIVNSVSEAKSGENVEATSSVPLSEYAKKLDQLVKKPRVTTTPQKTFGTGLFTTCGGYGSSILSHFGDYLLHTETV